MDSDVARELHELHAGVCKAIADPKRLLIITELRDGEMSVGQICEAIDISQSNASQHLAVLRERGIVRSRRSGKTVYYSLTSDKVVTALDLLRAFISEQTGVGGNRIGSVFLG